MMIRVCGRRFLVGGVLLAAILVPSGWAPLARAATLDSGTSADALLMSSTTVPSTATTDLSFAPLSTAVPFTDTAVPSTAMTEPSTADLDPLLASLNGRSFRATGTFSDAGGERELYEDAWLVLTFTESSAVAHTSCGENQYPMIAVLAERGLIGPTIDFGRPSGPGCRMDAGSNGLDIPTGTWMWFDSGTGRYGLTNGYYGLTFAETDASIPTRAAGSHCEPRIRRPRHLEHSGVAVGIAGHRCRHPELAGRSADPPPRTGRPDPFRFADLQDAAA